jgi:hypothetical protein
MDGPKAPGDHIVQALIDDIAEMAGHINRRFVPDAEKRRLFEAAASRQGEDEADTASSGADTGNPQRPSV